MPRFGRVVLGGTFDRLHVGHAALLTTAFRTGRSVAIGLTTDRYLADHPKPGAGQIQPYRTRRATLRGWLRARYPARRWTLVPLNDRFGGSVDPGVDALVVSADTVAGGHAVNAERRRRGQPPVPLLVVPLVLADDLGPVSSRRIRAGEVDRDGRRRSPIRVGVAVADAADRAPAIRGVRRAFSSARVVRVPFRAASSGPDGKLRSAATAAARGRELGVAIDAPSPSLRRLVVATPWAVLAPETVSRPSPGALSTGVAKVLDRSSARKPFYLGRK